MGLAEIKQNRSKNTRFKLIKNLRDYTMTMDFQAKVTFSLTDKDKKLYDKYGVPAIELANDGEFLAAIKLIDKILKRNPKCEFALLLKANYLFNYILNNLRFDSKINQNDINRIKKQAEAIKKQLEECIRLIDKALKINPKNKTAKELKKFIEKTCLKEIKNLINSAKNTKQKLTRPEIAVKIICPYCKKQYHVRVKKTKDEYICPKCRKTFLAIIGEVKNVRGLGGYVAHAVTIRIRNIEGGDSVITYYSIYQGNEFGSGDLLGVVYKKLWLSKSYGQKPAYIINWTTGICYDKL